MPDDLSELRAEVAATARRLVRAGLIAAFGHVSARTPGDGMIMTTVRPLAGCTSDDTVVLDADGNALDGPADALPLETPMHRAVYRVRADVGAICRGHPPAAVVWGTQTAPLPLAHGLAAMSGRDVRVHDDVDLIVDDHAADAVAATLGDDHAVLLRANGALAVGAQLDEAAVRLWYLDERASVALQLAAGAAPADTGVVDDATWDTRMRHTPAELGRAIQWFRTTFDDPR